MDYYSDIINQNCHKPKALFSIIDSVLNPHTKVQTVSSLTPEYFLRFFINKITDQRPHTVKINITTSESFPCTLTWSVFEPISLPALQEITVQLKPTFFRLISSPLVFKKKTV